MVKTTILFGVEGFDLEDHIYHVIETKFISWHLTTIIVLAAFL
jgi:hypothetical protein